MTETPRVYCFSKYGFDCRGIGASERRDEPFTIYDEMQDIDAVLNAVGLTRYTSMAACALAPWPRRSP